MIAQRPAHDGPALVEVLVHRQELAMPPTIEVDQMAGFGLFMLKAVLSGRGDQVIDLGEGRSAPPARAMVKGPCASLAPSTAGLNVQQVRLAAARPLVAPVPSLYIHRVSPTGSSKRR